MVLLWCSMPALKVRGAAPSPHFMHTSSLPHTWGTASSPETAQLLLRGGNCHAAWSMPFGPCRLVHADRFMLFGSCRLSRCLVQHPTCVAFLTPGPGPVQPAPAQRTELWVQLRGVRAGAWGGRGVGPVCTVHLSFKACLPSGPSMVGLQGVKQVPQPDTFTLCSHGRIIQFGVMQKMQFLLEPPHHVQCRWALCCTSPSGGSSSQACCARGRRSSAAHV